MGITIDSLKCNKIYFDGEYTLEYTVTTAGYYRINISYVIDKNIYDNVTSIYVGYLEAGKFTLTETLTEGDLSILYNKMRNTAQGQLRFTIRVYNDSDYTSEYSQQAIGKNTGTLYIPEIKATKPELTLNVRPVNEGLKDGVSDLYIQGLSRVQCTESVVYKYGATLANKDIRIDGIRQNLSYPFYVPGEIAVSGYVIDSRGFSSNAVEMVINILPYQRPEVSVSLCERCDKNGNPADDGAYLHIVAKRTYSPLVVDGNQRNSCFLRYVCHYSSGEEKCRGIILEADNESDEVDIVLEGVVEDASRTYLITIEAEDDVTEVIPENRCEITVISERVDLHLGCNKVAVGKKAERIKEFEIAEDWEFRMKGNKVVDFIIENGTCECVNGLLIYPDGSEIECVNVDRGTWYYTKYNSGKVEFIGSFYMVPKQSYDKDGYNVSEPIIIPLPFECEKEQFFPLAQNGEDNRC